MSVYMLSGSRYCHLVLSNLRYMHKREGGGGIEWSGKIEWSVDQIELHRRGGI
jgi:hypothetical protein